MTTGLPRPHLAFWRRPGGRVVLQAEAAECGLACLAMVADHHGHRIDMASMRQRFSVSRKGATLRSLIAAAERLQLAARPLKLSLKHLSELQLPCVLHWDMNHFVVLRRVQSRHVVIVDPAVGERRLPWREVSRHFTGVALELVPTSDFVRRVEQRRFSLLSLVGRVVGLRRSIGQLVLLGLALQVAGLALPFYLQWIVDEALVAGDRDLVTVLGVGFLLLVAMQTAMSAVRSWVTTVLTTQLNHQWLGNAFAHLLRLPLPWFEKRHLGDIVSRFGSIETIQHSLTTQFVEGVVDGVLVCGTALVMLLYSPALTALAASSLLLYALLRWAVFRSLRDATADQIVHAARQRTHFLESARGIQSVRLFNRVEERRIGWMNMLTEQFNADLRIGRIGIGYQTAHTFLFGVERIVVIWVAALAVIDARFTVGMLFAFIGYKDQLTQRTAALIDRLFELRMLRVHGERVADIVLADPEESPADNPSTLASASLPTGAVLEVRALGFRYADSEPPVLHGLNLTIPAGQCLAITGASGSGKTSLLKLLLGLLDPSEGDILYGGLPLRRLGLARFRGMVGTVMQDDTLFSGSLADNISFFDPSPSLRRIRECAELAAIHADITAMPMGYDTLVGDSGSGLSGGQKQRVLLARALYKRPAILMLDEATSHLDVWNEQHVNAAVKRLNLTRIIVAHRPETIAMAERVVVLEQGRVVRDLLVAPPDAPPEPRTTASTTSHESASRNPEALRDRRMSADQPS